MFHAKNPFHATRHLQTLHNFRMDPSCSESSDGSHSNMCQPWFDKTERDIQFIHLYVLSAAASCFFVVGSLLTTVQMKKNKPLTYISVVLSTVSTEIFCFFLHYESSTWDVTIH